MITTIQFSIVSRLFVRHRSEKVLEENPALNMFFSTGLKIILASSNHRLLEEGGILNSPFNPTRFNLTVSNGSSVSDK